MRIKFKIAFQPRGAPKWKYPQPVLEFYRGAVNKRYDLGDTTHLEFGSGDPTLQFQILEGPPWLTLYSARDGGSPAAVPTRADRRAHPASRTVLTSNAFLGVTNDMAVPLAPIARRVKVVLRVRNSAGFHDIEIGCLACQVRRYAA